MTPTGTDRDPDNLTRKQRREQARQERKAAEQAAAAATARRRRLMQLGGVAVVVVVVILVIVFATGGKSTTEPTTPKTASAKNEAAKTVDSLLSGIPQSGDTLGKATAPVTLQYFGDLECPICQEFTLYSLPGIIQHDVRTGKLKIEYRSFSTATGNAERLGHEPNGTFTSQQVAALAAGKQQRAWNYIELFYHEQGKEDSGYVNEAFLQGLASQVPGLNLHQWSSARGEKALENQIIEDERAATRIGFEGTPSFMIGKTGSKLKPFEPSSLRESSAFEPTIDKLAT